MRQEELEVFFYDYQDGSGLLYKGQNANGKASNISKELGKYSLNWENLFSLAKACGQAFLPSYEPIIKKRKNQRTNQSQPMNMKTQRLGRYSNTLEKAFIKKMEWS